MPDIQISQSTMRVGPTLQRIVHLTAGQSLYSRLQALVASNPAPGSVADEIKDYFTRTVPTGKEVDVSLILGVLNIVDV
jgi:hypothetical protein